jgi:FkbM family methyltransferase
MYYSLFGARGLLVGARAKLSCASITLVVAAPRLNHPIYLRVRTTDVALCREIFLNEAYGSEFREAPRVVVDVGANIGLSAVFYAHKFPNARIIAVEPEPSNYEMLRKNTAPYPNIRPVRAALWKENGEVSIFDPGAGNTTFQVRDADELSATDGAGRVQAMTLGKLMADYQLDCIDLLKLDVEGAEKEIFEHSAPWIDRVGMIAVELHDWIRGGCSESVRLAAKDFPFEWHRGEITYLARREHTVDLGHVHGRPGDQCRRAGPRFPLKILHTC